MKLRGIYFVWEKSSRGSIRSRASFCYSAGIYFYSAHTRTIFGFHTLLLSFQLLDKPWSQVSSLLPPGSCLRFLSRIGFSNPTHCSSIFHRVLLSHALALSESQFVHSKKSIRIYTSMHSRGLELMKTDRYQARG